MTATIHEFARRKRPHTAAPSGTGAPTAAGAPVATTHTPATVGGGPVRRPAHVPSSSVSHIAAGRPAPPDGDAAA